MSTFIDPAICIQAFSLSPEVINKVKYKLDKNKTRSFPWLVLVVSPYYCYRPVDIKCIYLNVGVLYRTIIKSWDR